MRYESNIQQVSERIQKKLNSLNDPNILREIAVVLRSSNQIRVFTDGRKADGSDIGTYSDAYLVRRVKGTSSKKRTRFTSDSTVILRNEGLLEADLKVVPISGGWAVAFTTDRSSELVPILEERYGQIWGISTQDDQAIDQRLSQEIKKRLG